MTQIGKESNKMLVRPIKLAAVILITAFVLGNTQAQSVSRPVLLTIERYHCLVGYADRLVVSARGNLVNISACPPQIEVNFTPSPELMNNYLILTADDLKCLLRGRREGHRIAFMRGQRKVAIYLRPCGRQR
jgi:hypothetical protein